MACSLLTRQWTNTLVQLALSGTGFPWSMTTSCGPGLQVMSLAGVCCISTLPCSSLSKLPISQCIQSDLSLLGCELGDLGVSWFVVIELLHRICTMMFAEQMRPYLGKLVPSHGPSTPLPQISGSSEFMLGMGVYVLQFCRLGGHCFNDDTWWQFQEHCNISACTKTQILFILLHKAVKCVWKPEKWHMFVCMQILIWNIKVGWRVQTAVKTSYPQCQVVHAVCP